MLVSLVFSLDLHFSAKDQLDHLEMFAGDLSVTTGEMQAWQIMEISPHDLQIIASSTPEPHLGISYRLTG